MTTIKLKNGSGAPTAGDLAQGEPALDLTNKRLYTEDSGGTVIEVGTNPTSITTGAITSTGIDVTGTVTADGLTVDSTLITIGSGGATNQATELRLEGTSNAGNGSYIRGRRDGSSSFLIGDTAGALGSGTGVINYVYDSNPWSVYTNANERLTVEGNGDISFYEDTGTTAKLFWDASAESLGIGTTTITAGRTLETVGGRVRFDNTADQYHIDLAVNGNTYAYIGSDTDNHLVFYNGSGNERMRIDSSGNLLVGRTLAGSGTGFEANTAFGSYILSTSTSIAGVFDRLSTDGEIVQFRKDGSTVGSIGTEVADGTTPADLVITAGTINAARLWLKGGDSGLILDGHTNSVLPTDENSYEDNRTNLGSSDYRFKDLYLSGGLRGDTTFKNNAGTTEYARFDSSGNLLVGTSSAGSVEGLYVAKSPSNANVGVARFDSTLANDESYTAASFVKASGTTTTSQIFIRFGINAYNNGCGQINANGVGQAAFGANSDRRLKENVLDLPNQLESITALRPVEFDYIESEGGGHQLGFIAQEVEEIYPDAVGERHDGMKVLSGLGKWEARLVKAIQEQNEIINDLRARVAQLEGAN
jgi:hypothetical protein